MVFFNMTLSLQSKYSTLCLPPKVDLTQSNVFPDYIEPNELQILKVKAHLQFLKKGYLVSTGTERSFFDLAFSPEHLCTGLIVCDINLKVKAYVDFNALLLRLSKTKEEYEALSRTTDTEEEFAKRISVITDKIQSGGLEDKVKKYWETHLTEFGAVYLKAKKLWRDSKHFDGCKYYQDDIQFNKLKRYADAGNIISIVGDINDLKFLKGETVSVVDVSNIPHYCFLNFQAEGKFRPRVIWTDLVKRHFCYHSYTYQPLSERQNEIFDEQLGFIKECTFLETKYPFRDEYAFWLVREQRAQAQDPFNADLGPFRSEKTLKFLQWYSQKNLLPLAYGVVNMATKDICALNEYSFEELEESLEDLQPFIKELAGAWKHLKPELYFFFCQLKGWNECFERYFLNHRAELDPFLLQMKADPSFQNFINEFTEARLGDLKRRCLELEPLIS